MRFRHNAGAALSHQSESRPASFTLDAEQIVFFNHIALDLQPGGRPAAAVFAVAALREKHANKTAHLVMCHDTGFSRAVIYPRGDAGAEGHHVRGCLPENITIALVIFRSSKSENVSLRAWWRSCTTLRMVQSLVVNWQRSKVGTARFQPASETIRRQAVERAWKPTLRRARTPGTGLHSRERRQQDRETVAALIAADSILNRQDAGSHINPPARSERYKRLGRPLMTKAVHGGLFIDVRLSARIGTPYRPI